VDSQTHEGHAQPLEFIAGSGRSDGGGGFGDDDGGSFKPAGEVDTNGGDIDDAFAIKHSGGARSQSANCSAARISVISIRIVAVE
jgi:hypothetical protein